MAGIVLPWAAAAIALAAIDAAVKEGERLPPPLPASVAATEFSAARAREHLEVLAGEIGERVTGSEANAAAARYLMERIEAIPGARLEVQHARGIRRGTDRATIYGVRNVLARVDGARTDEAVLVSTHYDTKTAGPGAGDAATPVAVALEVLGAVAASPRPARSVIFLFNDGEELGLFGADAFLQHPWAAHVRTFLNLESAGPGGRPVLFQIGPGNAWLASLWASEAPYPRGSVLAQDVFESGAIPSDTDFRVYRDDGGLRGIDFALYEDGWRYHTPLDTPEAVASGSIQVMGANALAMVRALATRPELPRDVLSPAVYYAVLGRTMIAMPRSLFRLISIALVLAALAMAAVVAVRRRIGVLRVVAGAILAIFGMALPLGVAVGLGWAAPALGRMHRWYASPEPAVLAWTAGAIGGLILAGGLASAVLRNASRQQAQAALLIGASLLWAAIVVAGTWLGLGSTWIAVWWLAAVLLALFGSAFVPRAGGAVTFLAILAPLALSVEVTRMFLAAFIPISGRMLLTIPFDPVLAALASIPVATVGPLAVAWLQGVRGRTFAGSIAFGFALTALTISIVQFPYSAERPQRVALRHEIEGERSWIAWQLFDQLGVHRPYRRLFGDAAPLRVDATVFATPASPPVEEPPAVHSNVLESAEGRKLLLEFGAGDWYEAVVRLPAGGYSSWTAWTADERFAGTERRIRLVNTSAILEIELTGSDTGEALVTLRSNRTTPALDRVVRSLPAWAAADPIVVRRIHVPTK
ncbi:MAG TPA: M28 family metallopeptidase [Thermoanaerobaculia bacterium]|nr:M28 family metallopeptidase [Thermoanaerobaculia bacterium]